MERIEQKIAEPIVLIIYSELVYLEQANFDDLPEHQKDVIQIEKQSIPALIDALKKYAE